MQRFSTKLTALTTAVSLVVASFVAFTHSHHGSHSHDGEACCGHHATLVQQDDYADGCCHEHHHDAEPAAVESASHDDGLQLASTEHQSHADHLCALCVFLTQHSADVSPEFHSDDWTCVSQIPDAVALSPTLSLFRAYYLRGPPQV